MIYRGYIAVRLGGLYRDNGKENGNSYFSRGLWEQEGWALGFIYKAPTPAD